MTELSIDTKNKQIRLRLDLAGEAEPLEVHILKYRLTAEEGGTYLIVEEAVASREWVGSALREFVVGQRLPVPDKAAGLLKLLS